MKKVIVIFAVIISLVSCKKTTPVAQDCTVNTTNIAGSYIISAVKYKSSAGTAETDLYASMEDCEKDNIYELKTDGTVIISEAANDCGLPPLPGTPSNWSLTENNRVLVMNASLSIVNFNCSTLIVEERNLAVDGDIRTTTYEKL